MNDIIEVLEDGYICTYVTVPDYDCPFGDYFKWQLVDKIKLN